MPTLQASLAFFTVALLLALSPGPDNLFVLVQSATGGRRAGFAVVAGLMLGVMVHTLAVALGLAAVFAGAANTPLACTLLAIELFGGSIGLFAALACAASYACSGHQGIYRAQRLEAPKHRPA